MERLYLDTNGDTQPRNAWDYHHVIPRSKAKSKGQRNFINQEGLKLPIFRIWHNLGATALHNNVGLAPMPGMRLARVITHTLLENQDSNVYDRFIEVADVVKGITEHSDELAFSKDAGRLSRSFDQQMPYILNGMVRDISEANRPVEAA
jgi:hypothetical protein